MRNAECGVTTATTNALHRPDRRARGEILVTSRDPALARRSSLCCGGGPAACGRAPGVAVFRGRVLTTGGLEAASSRLRAAPAACSPDLLGRGGHDGAIFPPLFFCQPASSRLSGPAAESCGGSPPEAGRPAGSGLRKNETTRMGLPPCFPRPKRPRLHPPSAGKDPEGP